MVATQNSDEWTSELRSYRSRDSTVPSTLVADKIVRDIAEFSGVVHDACVIFVYTTVRSVLFDYSYELPMVLYAFGRFALWSSI